MLQLEVAPSPYVQQQSWYSEAYPTSYEPRPERSSPARGMPLRMITTHINQALFPSTLLAHPAKDRRKRLVKLLTVSSTMLVTFITFVIFTSMHTDRVSQNTTQEVTWAEQGSSTSISYMLVPFSSSATLTINTKPCCFKQRHPCHDSLTFYIDIVMKPLESVHCFLLDAAKLGVTICVSSGTLLVLVCSGIFLQPGMLSLYMIHWKVYTIDNILVGEKQTGSQHFPANE